MQGQLPGYVDFSGMFPPLSFFFPSGLTEALFSQACEVPVCRCTDEISDGLAQCFKCVLRVDKGSTAMEAQGMLDGTLALRKSCTIDLLSLAFVAQCKSMDMKVKSQSIPGANMAVPLQRGMVTTVLAVSAVLLLL